VGHGIILTMESLGAVPFVFGAHSHHLVESQNLDSDGLLSLQMIMFGSVHPQKVAQFSKIFAALLTSSKPLSCEGVPSKYTIRE